MSKEAAPMKRETLADRVAANITELILSGSIPSETTLPTEPELAEQYGVSRSVVRDAAKLLSARGLVKIRHGKGVFVTASQREGFEDAMLLTLRRDHATVWDAEEFIDQLFLVAVSLATVNASDSEIDKIEELSNEFLETLDVSNDISEEDKFEEIAKAAQSAHDKARLAIFEATHNKVMQHIAEPLLALRRLRMWDFSQVIEDIEDIKDLEELDVRKIDRQFHSAMVECLRSRDPGRAFTVLSDLMQIQLPPEAIATMKDTPIGESPQIVLTPSSLEFLKEQLHD